MDELKLDVHVRTEIGSRLVRRTRRNQGIPAIIYGGKEKPVAVKVDRKEFERMSRLHRIESAIFHINVVEGEKKLKDYSAMIKAIQHHPVTDLTLHIDFNRISLTKEIEVKVPVESTGEAIGVKQDGGALDHIIWELEIVCLPTKIPKNIAVDISQLKIGDSIFVKDLKLPEGVRTKHSPEAIVFSVAAPMKEVTPEEAAAQPTAAEPEVLKEKKEDPAKAAKPAEGEGKAKPEGKEKEGK